MENNSKMSPQQIAALINDINYEIRRIMFVKSGAEQKLKKYNDLTERKQFHKKNDEKIMRSLRRLDEAKRSVENCVVALNDLSLQREKYIKEYYAVVEKGVK